MIKKSNIAIFSLIIIYYLFYVISLFANSTFWGDILSPVGSAISFTVIVAISIKASQSDDTLSVIRWLLTALGCLAWTLGDTIWAVCDLFIRTDPNNNFTISFTYFLTSFFFTIAICIFFISKVHKWNRVQLLLDVLATSCVFLYFLLITFFHNNTGEIQRILAQDTISFFSLFSDFFIFNLISICFIASRKHGPPRSILVSLLSFLLYVITDIFYFYQYFNHTYIPNTIIDGIYMASLLFLAFGVFYEKYTMNDKMSASLSTNLENYGRSYKVLALFLPPIGEFLIYGFRLYDFAVFVSIIMVYMMLSGYTQNAIKNEQLLLKEKDANLILEKKVYERTAELSILNKALDDLTKMDTITTLYNRRHFFQELDIMLLEANSKEESVYVLFIDMDHFKSINDSMGHNIADSFLLEIANRLSYWKSKESIIARMGGDEFLIAYKTKRTILDIINIAEQIIKSCSEPIFVGNLRFNPTLGIGISQNTNEARDAATMIKNADFAMRFAKRIGYNQLEVFNSKLSQKISRKNTLELILRQSDLHKEFQLFYQPQVDTKTGKVIGAEALLRWNNPKVGFVSPDEFIPILEETGLIVPAGDWILNEAMRQVSYWNNKYKSNFKIGINISPIQLKDTNFFESLTNAINNNSVGNSWIDLEITENVAMGGEAAFEKIFNSIAGMGITLSIDDFGTGYSSMSYLKNYSFNRIKIAKPLVDNINTNHNDIQILKAITMMSKALGISTIAEGVENEEQYNILKDIECDEVQGYYISKPIPAQDFEEKYFANAEIERTVPVVLNAGT